MNSTNEVVCPVCKGTVAMRINRNGFMPRRVLGFFGIYPWKCGACGSAFLFRRRGHRTRSESNASGHKHRQALKP